MFEQEDEIDICATEKERVEDIEEINYLNINGKQKIKSLKILHSNISILKGIQDFKNLTNLDLSSNKITSINIYLKYMSKLTALNLSCNLLSNISGIEYLISLEEVNLSHNKITNIDAFNLLSDNSQALRSIDLRDNLIQSLNQVIYLRGFSNLEILILNEKDGTNPICQNENYFDFIHDHLTSLKLLDSGNFLKSYNNEYYNKVNKATSGVVRREGNFNYNSTMQRTVKQQLPDKNFNRTVIKDNTLRQGTRYPNTYNPKEFKNEYFKELVQDYQELIHKYEHDEKEWKIKAEDLQENLKAVKNSNTALSTKYEEKDLALRESNNKLSLKDHEISSGKRHTDELEFKLQDMNNKYMLVKKDYEYANNDIEKLNRKINELNREINDLKDNNKVLKDNINKEENFYKELSQKKSDEVNEKIRIINSMENKVFEVTRSLADKQKEIENLIEMNNSLQNNVIKYNKLKNETEFELKNKFDKEKEELVNKYKALIDELQVHFNKVLQSKQDEFAKDLNAVVKNYEDEQSQFDTKLLNLIKDNEKVQYQLNDCKELLKKSLQNEEQNEKIIKELEQRNTQYHIEKENFRTKFELEKDTAGNRIKYMEIEIKDQNEQILKQDSVIKNIKAQLNEKEKEIQTLQEDYQKYLKKISVQDLSIDKLHKELECKDEEIEGLKNLMNSDPNLRKISELEEDIKTKDMMLTDHTNQIFELKNTLAYEKGERERELEKERSRTEKIKQKHEKKIQELKAEVDDITLYIQNQRQINHDNEETIQDLKNVVIQKDDELEALKHALNEKDELTKKIEHDIFDIRQFYEHSKSELKDKSEENRQLSDLLEELNRSLVAKNNENKEILQHFDSYRLEKENEIELLLKQNQELQNDIKFVLSENEEQKQLMKRKIEDLNAVFNILK
jgi:chromosome segregation ATPase